MRTLVLWHNIAGELTFGVELTRVFMKVKKILPRLDGSFVNSSQLDYSRSSDCDIWELMPPEDICELMPPEDICELTPAEECAELPPPEDMRLEPFDFLLDPWLLPRLLSPPLELFPLLLLWEWPTFDEERRVVFLVMVSIAFENCALRPKIIPIMQDKRQKCQGKKKKRNRSCFLLTRNQRNTRKRDESDGKKRDWRRLIRLISYRSIHEPRGEERERGRACTIKRWVLFQTCCAYFCWIHFYRKFPRLLETDLLHSNSYL